MKRNPVSVRMPWELDDLLTDIANKYAEQTGRRPNKQQAARLLAQRLKGRTKVRGPVIEFF